MKKQLTTIALTIFLAITSGGWVHTYNTNNKLEHKIEQKENEINSITTKIAKLEEAIVNMDDELDAKEGVIAKQKDQLKELEKKNRDIENKNKKIEKDIKKKEATISNLKQMKAENRTAKPKQAVTTTSTKNFTNKTDGSGAGTSIGNFEMTSYTQRCNGCTGITRAGVDIRGITTYQGHRIIATDTSIIPLWSIVRVKTESGQSFTAIALDTGGAINGRIIDYLVATESEAMNNGRQIVSIEMIRRGK